MLLMNGGTIQRRSANREGNPMRKFIVSTAALAALSVSAYAADPAKTRIATAAEFEKCASAHKLGGDARYPLRKGEDYQVRVVDSGDPRIGNKLEWRLKQVILDGPHGTSANTTLKACERVEVAGS
jgi:hypothetical protein